MNLNISNFMPKNIYTNIFRRCVFTMIVVVCHRSLVGKAQVEILEGDRVETWSCELRNHLTVRSGGLILPEV